MFYTYLWLREDGTPYYVGKGKGKRAYISSAHGVHRPVSRSKILVQDCASENEAFEVEKFFVSYFGRVDKGTGCLRNLTAGGEGCVGARVKHSEETKAKMRKAALGNKNQRGTARSPEARRKIKESWERRRLSNPYMLGIGRPKSLLREKK